MTRVRTNQVGWANKYVCIFLCLYVLDTPTYPNKHTLVVLRLFNLCAEIVLTVNYKYANIVNLTEHVSKCCTYFIPRVVPKSTKNKQWNKWHSVCRNIILYIYIFVEKNNQTHIIPVKNQMLISQNCKPPKKTTHECQYEECYAAKKTWLVFESLWCNSDTFGCVMACLKIGSPYNAHNWREHTPFPCKPHLGIS